MTMNVTKLTSPTKTKVIGDTIKFKNLKINKAMKYTKLGSKLAYRIN